MLFEVEGSFYFFFCLPLLICVLPVNFMEMFLVFFYVINSKDK